MGRPRVELEGWRYVVEKISLEKDGVRDLGTGVLDPRLAQLEPYELGVGERSPKVSRQLSRARADV